MTERLDNHELWLMEDLVAIINSFESLKKLAVNLVIPADSLAIPCKQREGLFLNDNQLDYVVPFYALGFTNWEVFQRKGINGPYMRLWGELIHKMNVANSELRNAYFFQNQKARAPKILKKEKNIVTEKSKN